MNLGFTVFDAHLVGDVFIRSEDTRGQRSNFSETILGNEKSHSW